MPLWSRKGDELFYVREDEMIGVAIVLNWLDEVAARVKPR